jgi:hypothetical protein
MQSLDFGVLRANAMKNQDLRLSLDTPEWEAKDYHPNGDVLTAKWIRFY